MLIQQLALISESPKITFKDTALISAALQKQIIRDFTPIWQFEASIDPFESQEDVPHGYWRIIIKDNIDSDQLGFHLDNSGQPYANVLASELNSTSLYCSHEAMEMLIDPFGNRLVASDSLKEEQGRVSFIVEACDPCQARDYGYTVNSIVVSDFYTPNYFDPITANNVRYSYTSAIKAPKQILPGGYLSWITQEENELWQANFFSDKISFRRLGTFTQKDKSWRELVDGITSLPPLKNHNKIKKSKKNTNQFKKRS
jgi:hypothetical protein